MIWRRFRMIGLDIESWALTRAHHIVLNEGLNLAKAAQDLDRKRSRTLVYELQKVIAAAILEAHAASMSGSLQAGQET
ncbi:MAG: hypothetical protein AAAB20_19285 [Rhizobium sp.]|uniref:hypothetical protein n=2 Tax=unclassified Rhizobium TaxID=2613769 RepID=UPI0030F2D795